MENKTYYYDVGVCIDSIWASNTFTYSHSDELSINSVVTVPFGKSEKLGYVIKKTAKPKFKTKPITRVIDYSISTNTSKFIDWLSGYYPGSPGSQVQYFLPSYLAKIDLSKDEAVEPVKPKSAGKLPPLTNEQKVAIGKISSNWTKNNILHGITGSGKTRIYIEMIVKSIESGRHSLVLIPEISLSSQLSKELSNYFGPDIVHTYNSKQAGSKQKNTWRSALLSKSPQIFIGPRSALFLPYSDLGLIVMDEAHDSSYKQSTADRYNGVVVAAYLAKLYGAKLILGSATPPVSETYQLLAKGAELVCMHKLAKNIETTRHFIAVDMTDKSNLLKKSRLISKQMATEIKNNLKDKAQTLVYLNRRGTSRLIICQECGWTADCNKCGMPKTYHHDTNTFQCHICGDKSRAIFSCPKCSSGLKQENPGIKSLAMDLQKLFPDARIERFDSDNKKAESFNERYDDIKKNDVDIIIGTQIITKGLDLPHLSSVCVVNTQSNLSLPDFNSIERTFQQLTQVSGRVGRGHKNGTIILQSYGLSKSFFTDIIAEDWHRFYENELISRKISDFPPYVHLLKVSVSKPSASTALKNLNSIIDSLSDKKINILGPAPSFYEKSNGKHNWQIIIRSKSRSDLVSIVKNLPKNTYYDLDPIGLL